MPGVDGYQAASGIRRIEREAGAPRAALIALTAGAMAEDRRASAAAGFDEFLAKPVDLARLAETIERVLAGRAVPPAPARARCHKSVGQEWSEHCFAKASWGPFVAQGLSASTQAGALGALDARLATTKQEIRRARKLRYRVFFEEAERPPTRRRG